VAGRYSPTGLQFQNLALVANREGSTVASVKYDGTEEVGTFYPGRNAFGWFEGAAQTSSTNTETGFTGASTPNQTGGFTYLRNRWYDAATGRFLTQDPIGLAGGVNLYAYAGNNPVAYTDPFGLKAEDEIYYDENGKEVGRVEKAGKDEHYLVLDGKVSRLDYGLVEGSTPYAISHDPAMFDAQALALANSAPEYTTDAQVFAHSWPGGTLDFKKSLPDRSLYNTGDMYVHKHAVGNAAWGAYMANQGFAMSKALRGGAFQGALRGGEDNLDQTMIRRGYGIGGR
jgi:RHS repeat-associated protein